MVKNPRGMQETGVPSLSWEYPLGEEMATHSSILAWRIPWTEEPGRLQSTGSQRVRQNWATERASTLVSIAFPKGVNCGKTVLCSSPGPGSFVSAPGSRSLRS